MSETNILEMQGIEKAFSGIGVLKRANFTLRRGELHAVTGDAFDAGRAVALCKGMDPEAAVRFTGSGSQAGVVSFERPLDFMKTTPVKATTYRL